MLKLTIVLRKEVATLEESEALFQLVVERFADKPEIRVNGSVSNHYQKPEEPS